MTVVTRLSYPTPVLWGQDLERRRASSSFVTSACGVLRGPLGSTTEVLPQMKESHRLLSPTRGNRFWFVSRSDHMAAIHIYIILHRTSMPRCLLRLRPSHHIWSECHSGVLDSTHTSGLLLVTLKLKRRRLLRSSVVFCSDLSDVIHISGIWRRKMQWLRPSQTSWLRSWYAEVSRAFFASYLAMFSALHKTLTHRQDQWCLESSWS